MLYRSRQQQKWTLSAELRQTRVHCVSRTSTAHAATHDRLKHNTHQGWDAFSHQSRHSLILQIFWFEHFNMVHKKLCKWCRLSLDFGTYFEEVSREIERQQTSRTTCPPLRDKHKSHITYTPHHHITDHVCYAEVMLETWTWQMCSIIRWQSRVFRSVLTFTSRTAGSSTRTLTDMNITHHHSTDLTAVHMCQESVPADVMKRLLIFQLLSDAVRVRGHRAPAVNQVPEEVTRLIWCAVLSNHHFIQ